MEKQNEAEMQHAMEQFQQERELMAHLGKYKDQFGPIDWKTGASGGGSGNSPKNVAFKSGGHRGKKRRRP